MEKTLRQDNTGFAEILPRIATCVNVFYRRLHSCSSVRNEMRGVLWCLIRKW